MADFTPQNYSIDVATPMQSAAQGYALGAGIRDDQQAQAAKVAALQQQQQQQQVIRSLINNPNPTADDYAKATLLVPQLKDQFKQAHEMRNADQQANDIKDTGQWYAAVKNGTPEIAVQQMRDRADTMEKTGAPPRDVQAMRANADAVEAHPQLALTTMGIKLSSLPGGDKVITSLSTMGSNNRADQLQPAELAIKNAQAKKDTIVANAAPVTVQQTIDKTNADIANTKSETEFRAKQFGLDQDKLYTETQLKMMEMKQKNGELPEPVRKDVDSSVTESITAKQSADKMYDLADRLQKEGGGYGSFSTAGEWIKGATGNQNEMTRLRSEYGRMVTPAAMAAYKKVASGSTSDTDIETAMKGVPKDTANADTMAAYLRGVAKLQTYNSVIENAKAEWLGTNKTLGKASQDMVVDGVKVPAGTTFNNFNDQYVEKKATELNHARLVQSWAQKYPAPAAPQTGGASTGY